MDRRGFLKTLLMIPVAALLKPREVPALIGEVGKFKGISIVTSTLTPKWFGEWVGYGELRAMTSARMAREVAGMYERRIYACVGPDRFRELKGEDDESSDRGFAGGDTAG